MHTKTGRRKVEDKGQHLINQAERARRFAGECGSPLVQALYEIHAGLCEEKIQLTKLKKFKKRHAS